MKKKARSAGAQERGAGQGSTGGRAGQEATRQSGRADARHRAAMFWMLREASASYAKIGRSNALSIERVRQICQGYGYQLHRRSEYTNEKPFMARLRRAGTLPDAAECKGGTILEPRFEPRCP